MRSTSISFLLSLAGVLAACSPQPKVDAKSIQEALRPVVTRADFIKTVEANGLKCYSRSEQDVSCTYVEPRPFWQITYVMVSAHGSFVDGRKSGEYVVRNDVTGP